MLEQMGLGKTAQSIAVLYTKYNWGHRGPFLVIAPLSTLEHWNREVATWTKMVRLAWEESSYTIGRILHCNGEVSSRCIGTLIAKPFSL